MRNIITAFVFIFLLSVSAGNCAFAADTIKIAAIFAKTGDAATSTIHHYQAVRYAVDEINSKGGLLGKKIKIIELDNNSSPIRAKRMAMAAVKEDVTAVIGCSWSDHSYAAARVLQKHGIPMLSPDSTNPKVTKVGNYIFRVGFVDSLQGKVLADFAAQILGAKNAVVIQCVNSLYSLGLSDNFQNEFKLKGGKILKVFDYKHDQKDFSAIIGDARKLNPELLFIPGYDESGLIAKQAQALGLDAVMLGGDGWSYREFYANGGMELKRGYYTCHWTKGLPNPISRNFVKKYQKIYEVNESAALTYDSVMILARAILDAGSLDRASIRDALSSMTDFPGVTGTISLNETGDPVRPVIIMEITNGTAEFFRMITPGDDAGHG